MASTQAHSLHAQPGPINQNVVCAHGYGGIVLPDDPHGTVTIDGTPRHLAGDCGETATFRVPGRPMAALGTVALCPTHLRRYFDAFPDVEAKLRERFDVAAHLPSQPRLTLAQTAATRSIDGVAYRRLGVDQHAAVHYYAAVAHTVVVTDVFLRPERVEPLDDRPLSDWLEYVTLRRGWRDLDDDLAWPGGDVA